MINWTKELDVELDQLTEHMQNRWSDVADVFSVRASKEELRSRWRSPEHRKNIREHYMEQSTGTQIKTVQRSQELMADGSIKVDSEISLDGDRRNDMIGDRELLEAHNLDPDRLQLVRAKSSNWQVVMSEGDERVLKTLFQSSVTVKPWEQFVDWDAIGRKLDGIVPVFEPTEDILYDTQYKQDRNLVVHLTDLHFGNAKRDDYAGYFKEIQDQLSMGYKRVVIACTGDLLNEDNYDGTTRRGTQIGQTDMTQAWLDAFDMLSELIMVAHDHTAEDVQFIYVGGNHDWFSGHTVILALIRAFKNMDRISFDWSKDTFKATMLDNVMIAAAHGDIRNMKDYAGIYASRFPEMWGKASVRECFIGHLHHAESFKKFDSGMMIRRSPTRTPEDDYSNHNAYDRDGKMFLLYEYTPNKYKAEYAI